MAALLFYLVAGAAAAVAVVRAYRSRASPDRAASVAYVTLLSSLAVTFAVMATPSQAWVNRFVPDLFKLVGNCGTLVAVCSGSLLVKFTDRSSQQHASGVRHRIVALVFAIAVMAVTFFLPHPVELTGSFDAYLAIDPTLVVYTTVYAAYLVVALADVTVNLWRFGGNSAGLLRHGLWVIAVGSVAGVAYAAAKIVIVVHHVLTDSRTGAGDALGVCHEAFESPACIVAVGAPVVAVALLLVGVVLTTAAAYVEQARRLLRYRRILRRLDPLRYELRAAFPEIGRAPAPPTRDVPRALAQCAVEIRDGLLLLSPYRRSAVAEAAREAAVAAGLTGDRQAAVVEAAVLTAALADYVAGHRPAAQHVEVGAPVDDDLDAELSWLDQVAHAYATSPLVAEHRARGRTVA